MIPQTLKTTTAVHEQEGDVAVLIRSFLCRFVLQSGGGVVKIRKSRSTSVNGLVILLIAALIGFGSIPVFAGSGPVIPGYYGSNMESLVPPSVNALPVVQSYDPDIISVSQVSNNELVVSQSEDKAVIDWESFDIGANAQTRFDQQGNAAWSVLNRIHDSNPSQIFGKLTADGTVYLINTNGFLFGADSVVSVHSLTASALNISGDDFLNQVSTAYGMATFTDSAMEDVDMPATTSDATIVNQGTIESGIAGSINIIAPKIVNSGTINSPVGRVFLGAGTEAEIGQAQNPDTVTGSLDVTEITGTDSGTTHTVLNDTDGTIMADAGAVVIEGDVINQQGTIRTVTTLKNKGVIVLSANDTVLTGEESRTLNYVSDSEEQVDSSFDFNPGIIQIEAGDMIEHNGEIRAVGGDVTLTAGRRVYLADGSLTDASGATANRDAQDSVVTVQLNSVELRDDQLQKDGILYGKDISFLMYDGSSIGNVSGYLDTTEKTVAEMAVDGGYITVSTGGNGDVIIRDGATIDISGGATWYESGYVDTTFLSSGNRVYSISDAPETLTYDSILGSYEKVYERYGITETLDGLYCGGATPVKQLVRDFYIGADAGTLKINKAATIVFDGELDGTVHPGLYQTEDGEDEDELGYDLTLGVTEPTGGSLLIGSSGSVDPRYINSNTDQQISSIVISSSSEKLPESFDPETGDLSDYECLLTEYTMAGSPLLLTILTDDLLSESGLSTLTMGAVTDIVVMPDVSVELEAEGSLIAAARNIEIYGSLIVPSGTVDLAISGNITTDSDIDGTVNPFYISTDEIGPERLYLGDTAVINTSGEEIDNSRKDSNGYSVETGHFEGGYIYLYGSSDTGEGIILKNGSQLIADGGYEIDQDGEATGGDAGEIHLMGTNLILDGDLSVKSLEGCKGGTIHLQSESITVSSDGPNAGESLLDVDFSEDDPLPEELKTGFVLDDERLSKTGAAEIFLEGNTGLTVEEGVYLKPSYEKYMVTLTDADDDSGKEIQKNELTVSKDYAGETGISLSAGTYFLKGMPGYDPVSERENALVTILEGSWIQTGPEGDITVSAPAVRIAGTLDATAGDISIEASGWQQTGKDLVLESTAQVLATGYNLAKEEAEVEGGAVERTPLDGGHVTIDSNGGMEIEAGALIDVSGADAVEALVLNADNKGETIRIAGNPGSVTLVNAPATIPYDSFNATHDETVTGFTGGAISIERGTIELTQEMIRSFLNQGFDDFSFIAASNNGGIVVSGDEFSFSEADGIRCMTLDAPVIATEGPGASIYADWMILTNSIYHNSSLDLLDSGDSTLHLSGNWLDISGSIDFDGFETVHLSSQHDIRLGMKSYQRQINQIQLNPVGDEGFYGDLYTEGDLIIEAARIYPETEAKFTLQSDSCIKTLAVESGDLSPVYSVDGTLILVAPDIEHNSSLVAPLGEIVLCGNISTDNGETTYDAAEKVILSPGSVIDTHGETLLNYGRYNDDGVVWVYDKYEDETDLTGIETEVSAVPEKSIIIAGETVVSQEGAEINVSGGGSVYAYAFREGVQGSVDPLDGDGVYVLVPVVGDSLPGEGVYLAGNDLVAEGRYVIMSAEYAFLPGAVVVEDLGETSNLTANQMTDEGYSLAIGYLSAAGQEDGSAIPHAFSVRNAADVLEEGNYAFDTMSAGNAGEISIDADTNLIGAEIIASGDEGYMGGSLELAGIDISVSTRDDIDYSLLDDLTGLSGVLNIDPDTLTRSGLALLGLGNENTETVTVAGESYISADTIQMTASESIEIQSGAVLDSASSTDGEILLSSESGSITLEDDTLLHAGGGITLDAEDMTLDGTLKIDNGPLTLISDTVHLVNGTGNDSIDDDGLMIDDDFWGMIFQDGNSLTSLVFESRSEILCDQGLELLLDEKSGFKSLTLDSKIIRVGNGGSGDVVISAPELTLTNNGDKFAGSSDDSSGTSAISFNATAGNLIVEFAPRADATIEDDNSADEDVESLSRELILAGTGEAELSSVGDIVFKGDGTLVFNGDRDTASGTLVLSGRKITSELNIYTDNDGQDQYKTARVTILADSGTIEFNDDAYTMDTESLDTSGGILDLEALSIILASGINLPGGSVSLTATGSGAGDGVYIKNGGSIDVAGTDLTPAGEVELIVEKGHLSMESGSLIDVSSGGIGDDGTVTLTSPLSEAVLDGALTAGGDGGNFFLDTSSIANFSSLGEYILNGGFTDTISIRTRNDSIVVDTAVEAENITLSADVGTDADSGSITITGTGSLDASGTQGGLIALYAGGDLSLEAGSGIASTGSTGQGGEVLLSSTDGALSFEDGASINVSSASSTGGQVSFNAPLVIDENNVAITLAGTVKGASSVVLTATEATTISDETLDTAELESLITDTMAHASAAWVNTASQIEHLSLTDSVGDMDELVHLTTGVEIVSEGNIYISGADLDLSDLKSGVDEEAGTLTLRSGGDLTINANIVDHPTPYSTLESGGDPDSWNIRLVAGANTGAANRSAVKVNDGGTGKLTIDDGVMIYTESGSLTYASRLDTVLGSGGDVVYYMSPASSNIYNDDYYCSLATFDGRISGYSGADLVLEGGSIQSGTGNIDLSVHSDLRIMVNGGHMGSIRTTGEAPAVNPDGIRNIQSFQLFGYYSNGGSISVETGGNIEAGYFNGGWDISRDVYYTDPESLTGLSIMLMWAGAYDTGSNTTDVFQGIGTLGGGDVSLASAGAMTCPAGTFGNGDLNITAGGNLNGRFLVSDGIGSLYTAGSFGSLSSLSSQTIEMMASDVNLTAQGEIVLGGVINPTMTVEPYATFGRTYNNLSSTRNYWNMTYVPGSEIDITSGYGDIIISKLTVDDASYLKDNTNNYLPPSVSVISGKDIVLESNLTLVPSSEGSLVLAAPEGSIIGTKTGNGISMYSNSEDEIYCFNYDVSKASLPILSNNTEPIHGDLDSSIRITAGEDIQKLTLLFPMTSEITAERDIIDLKLTGLTIDSQDVTKVCAGRNLFFNTRLAGDVGQNPGILVGGPGTLLVTAGNMIDLGTSDGIITDGATRNTYLDDTGTDLIIISGYENVFESKEDLDEFLNTLRTEGIGYTENIDANPKASEDYEASARKLLAETFGEATGSGIVDMIQSNVSTKNEGDITLISSGTVNVGESVISDEGISGSNTGFNTMLGGSIDLIASGDINVNESRVMSWYGGDITMCSFDGDINAGKGSRTEVSSGSSTYVYDEYLGKIVGTGSPAALGSGIRALTFDIDGEAGPKEAPAIGDVYLFAFNGVIDAGEAGIYGSNVYLGAQRVLNVQNISFSQGAIGTPIKTESNVNLGAITGAGNVSAASTGGVSTLDALNDQFEDSAKEMEQTFLPTWFRVEFMGFDVDDRGL